MVAVDQPSESIFQEFEDEDGNPFCGLPTYFDANRGERFVLWSEMERTFI